MSTQPEYSEAEVAMIVESTRLADLAAEQISLGRHEEAIELLRQSLLNYDHPVAALRIAQQLFALGRFSEIEYPQPDLWTDGWIRVGIMSSALQNDQPALQSWLAYSEKVTQSKFIQAFLEVIHQSDQPLSQRARRIVPVLAAKDYAGLLRL